MMLMRLGVNGNLVEHFSRIGLSLSVRVCVSVCMSISNARLGFSDAHLETTRMFLHSMASSLCFVVTGN